MSPIPIPQELSVWSDELIADVEFIRKHLYHTDEDENAMDWSEICAVLRYRHQKHRFINPWDVASIIEWLATPDVFYGSLKENTKTMIATLGESRIETWRETIKYDLKIAKQKGYRDAEMFEEEDPRRGREQTLTPLIFTPQSRHESCLACSFSEQWRNRWEQEMKHGTARRIHLEAVHAS